MPITFTVDECRSDTKEILRHPHVWCWRSSCAICEERIEVEQSERKIRQDRRQRASREGQELFRDIVPLRPVSYDEIYVDYQEWKKNNTPEPKSYFERNNLTRTPNPKPKRRSPRQQRMLDLMNKKNKEVQRYRVSHLYSYLREGIQH